MQVVALHAANALTVVAELWVAEKVALALVLAFFGAGTALILSMSLFDTSMKHKE